MDKYEHLRRTKESWKRMRETFWREWEDGYEAIKRQDNWRGTFQVIDYYKAHGDRMIRERWPWIKEDK